MGVNSVIRNLRIVFGNWKYTILGVFIAILFYALNVLIANLRNIATFYSSLGFFGTVKIFFVLMIGFMNLIKLSSYISLVAISILFGLLISLLVYKTKLMKQIGTTKTGFLASIGLFLGILAPGCAACGIGILSLLGIGSAFLTFLPFDGLELSILAIGILCFVILKVSNELTSCNIVGEDNGKGKM